MNVRAGFDSYINSKNANEKFSILAHEHGFSLLVGNRNYWQEPFSFGNAVTDSAVELSDAFFRTLGLFDGIMTPSVEKLDELLLQTSHPSHFPIQIFFPNDVYFGNAFLDYLGTNCSIWLDLSTLTKETKEERDTVERLKKEWLRDPCWDLYDTHGFDRYKPELVDYQRAQQVVWDQKNAELDQEIHRKAEELGLEGLYRLFLDQQKTIERLEDTIANFQ